MRAVRSNPTAYHWVWEGQPTGADYFNVCVHIRGRELVMHLHPGGDGFRRHRYGMGGAYVRASLHNETDVVQKAGLDAAHDLSEHIDAIFNKEIRRAMPDDDCATQ